MRIYIAGPIDGVADAGARFRRAECLLLELGHEPVNPMAEAPEGAPWTEHMKRDIRLLLDCEAIFLPEGWASSPGARLEAQIAGALEIARFNEGSHGPNRTERR